MCWYSVKNVLAIIATLIFFFQTWMSVCLVYITATEMLPVVILLVALVAHAMSQVAFLEMESHALVSLYKDIL